MSAITPSYVTCFKNQKLAPLVQEIAKAHFSICPALPESYKNILPDAKTIARKLQSFNLDSSDEEGEG
jgi:hypothetical protein